MSDNQIVDSSFTAIINAPIEKIDIPRWCFTLPEKEYQSCSPAHIAAGFRPSTPCSKTSSPSNDPNTWVQMTAQPQAITNPA